jgi:GTP cyclohydrolase I
MADSVNSSAACSSDDDAPEGFVAKNRGVDLPRIERAVREILAAVGEDPDREGLLETPARVARMYAEMFSGLHDDPRIHLKKVLGLSKLARVVEVVSKRPQVQERLTETIADLMVSELDPKGVAVVVEASHSCMTIRGIRKPGSMAVTSAMRGIFRSHLSSRSEIMTLIYGRSGQ